MMSSWVVLFLAFVAGFLAACGSTETTRPAMHDEFLAEMEGVEETEDQDAPLSADAAFAAGQARGEMTKDEIVSAYEKKMQVFLGQAVKSLEEIRLRFKDLAEGLEIPLKIQAVETELYDFYDREEEAFEAQVTILEERFEKEMTRTLEFLEPKIWEMAFDLVGSEDLGSSYGSRTGIDDVDGIAQATLELLRFRSGLTEFRDSAQFIKHQRISLDRIYKHDVEDQGRFSIFVSDPMRHFFRKDEDVVAVTVAYQKKGIDHEIPIEFIQVVRNRMVRGGTTLFDSKFHLDPNLRTDDGRLSLEENEDFPEVVVSEVFYPRLNMDASNYDRFRDYTAIRDYKTAVVNAETGEILDAVSWQYKWQISHFGRIAVEKGSPAVQDEEASEIKKLMK